MNISTFPFENEKLKTNQIENDSIFQESYYLETDNKITLFTDIVTRCLIKYDLVNLMNNSMNTFLSWLLTFVRFKGN